MTLGNIYEAVSVAVGFATLLAYVIRLSARLGGLAVKVDTMWDFMMRRAVSEAVVRGYGELRTPFHINAAGAAVVIPFIDKFLPLYTEMVRKGMSDNDMYLEFERQFGDFINEHICIPNALTKGSCLVAILETCRTEKPEDAGHKA